MTPQSYLYASSGALGIPAAIVAPYDLRLYPGSLPPPCYNRADRILGGLERIRTLALALQSGGSVDRAQLEAMVAAANDVTPEVMALVQGLAEYADIVAYDGEAAFGARDGKDVIGPNAGRGRYPSQGDRAFRLAIDEHLKGQ